MYDLIIIGSGPAGLGAAIYAEQARLNTLVIEKAAMSGGQILLTEAVDNYPGIPSIGGFELGQKLRERISLQTRSRAWISARIMATQSRPCGERSRSIRRVL